MTFTTEPLAAFSSSISPRAIMIGAKKLTRNTWRPGVDVGIDRAQPCAAFGLGRDRGVVDQRMQLAAVEPRADFLDRARGVGVVGEVDLDVVLGPGVPRAFFRERDAANR